ncbi:MAG: SDR family NAD(P)-dependent oxidoreductase [Phycicoccus sp.]
MTQRILVTGAARGIGRELVRQLAARGDTVVAGVRDPDAAAALVDIGGGRVLVRRLDVTSRTDAERVAVDIRDELGGLDALVNNAAVHYDTGQHAADADLRIVDEAIATNLIGAWRTTIAMAPLLPSGGRVVNVSSGAGSFGETGASAVAPAYSVSKAGLDMLTVKLAADLGRRGVLVNAVCPGWVATDMGGSGGRPSSTARRA